MSNNESVTYRSVETIAAYGSYATAPQDDDLAAKHYVKSAVDTLFRTSPAAYEYVRAPLLNGGVMGNNNADCAEMGRRAVAEDAKQAHPMLGGFPKGKITLYEIGKIIEKLVKKDVSAAGMTVRNHKVVVPLLTDQSGTAE